MCLDFFFILWFSNNSPGSGFIEMYLKNAADCWQLPPFVPALTQNLQDALGY